MRDEISARRDRLGGVAQRARADPRGARSAFRRRDRPCTRARARQHRARDRPDGRLYALGADDSAATRLRLDVLDAATGRILDTRAPNAGDRRRRERRGSVRFLDPDSLLAQAPTKGRVAFAPAFALPDLAGKTVRLAEYEGKVTLVNFWASWCEPCREEFPHMAALYREFGRQDLAIAAISDDVDAGKMRAFVRELRPPFPILVGRGKMKATYHYRGLPYSVLLDREGRVRAPLRVGGETEFRRSRN